jgi:hypothetical protein
LLAVILSSCTDPLTPLREELDQQRVQIEEMKQERAALEQRHVRELEDLRSALNARHQVEMQDLRATLQRTINESTRRIYALREELAARPAEPAAADAELADTPFSEPAPSPVDEPAPAISVFQPPRPDVSDFIETPTGGGSDLFPVRVSQVRGTQKVIGTVVTSRLVETGQTYKDAFGAERPVMRQEAVETKQFDYEVQFEVQNRTRNPVSIAFRAGRERQSATLAPGGSTLLTVNSLRGADLTVIAGNDRRSYPVTYR